jgi:hypothetical protein
MQESTGARRKGRKRAPSGLDRAIEGENWGSIRASDFSNSRHVVAAREIVFEFLCNAQRIASEITSHDRPGPWIKVMDLDTQRHFGESFDGGPTMINPEILVDEARVAWQDLEGRGFRCMIEEVTEWKPCCCGIFSMPGDTTYSLLAAWP